MIISVKAEEAFDKIQRLLYNKSPQQIRSGMELPQPGEGHIQNTADVILKCERSDAFPLRSGTK